jgi:hypothetical protein
LINNKVIDNKLITSPIANILILLINKPVKKNAIPKNKRIKAIVVSFFVILIILRIKN